MKSFSLLFYNESRIEKQVETKNKMLYSHLDWEKINPYLNILMFLELTNYL